MQDDNLYISDVTVEDRGLYVCRAENRDGTAQASAIVEVESELIFREYFGLCDYFINQSYTYQF